MSQLEKLNTLLTGFNKKNTILLMIDEFSSLYKNINPKELKIIMQSWKSFHEKNIFKSALIGQDYMPEFIETYANEFGIMKTIELTYLTRNDAMKLIEEPIQFPDE